MTKLKKETDDRLVVHITLKKYQNHTIFYVWEFLSYRISVESVI